MIEEAPLLDAEILESVVEFYAALNLLSKESVSSDAINLMRQSGSKYKEDSQAINGEILNLVRFDSITTTLLIALF